MNEPNDILAWLLAAEEHPHLRQEVEYLHAEEALHASPELRRALEEARIFAQKHPRLLGFGTMPGDVRLRIAYRLKEAVRENSPPVLHPWSVRRQFAWAALLVLFLGGMSLLSTTWLEMNHASEQIAERKTAIPPPRRMDDFYHFVSQVTREAPPIQHEGTQMVQLVSWLGEQDGITPDMGTFLRDLKGMGCAVLEGPHGKVSMLCVDMQGNRYNLFIGCAKSLRREPASARRFQLENREVLEWVDEHNAFLLIPEIFGTSVFEILL